MHKLMGICGEHPEVRHRLSLVFPLPFFGKTVPYRVVVLRSSGRAGAG